MNVTTSELRIQNDAHVRTLTIDRPDRSNALSRSLMTEMVEALLSAMEDPDVRVVVVTGAGDRSFCAGADLKDIGGDDAAAARFRDPMHRPQRSIFEVLSETYKPTIAAMNGHAVGGGFELALACDLRVAAAGAPLGLPEVRVGVPSVIQAALLPPLIGPGRAAELLLTGETIPAERAGSSSAPVRMRPGASSSGDPSAPTRVSSSPSLAPTS